MWYFAFSFFFNDTATTEIYTLSLHDALPISGPLGTPLAPVNAPRTLAYDASDEAKSPGKAFLLSLLLPGLGELYAGARYRAAGFMTAEAVTWVAYAHWRSKGTDLRDEFRDRKSTRLNSSHW